LQNTGWKSPSAIHSPFDWTTPEKAYVSDDTYATVIHGSGCRCPFMDLSWDDGTSYGTSNIFGPYGTIDSYRTQGNSTDGWGHTWNDYELSDSVFVLRIWNPSTLLKQGYAVFGFGIPSGSSISGIEVQVEAHGDSNFTKEMVDHIQAKVYYYLPTAVNEIYADNNPVRVYPNPAHQSIHLRFSNDESATQLQILSMEGRLVSEKTLEEKISGNDYTFDVSHLSSGIYFLNITTASRTINTRVVIE
jgi:hypothetical protein